MYPSNLWHTDVRAFEWLQACAIANQLKLRETDPRDGRSTQTPSHQAVSTLGLHMLLYPQHPGHNAELPLQNAPAGSDVTAVLKLAQLARRHGKRSKVTSNPLLQAEPDTIPVYS